MKQTRLYLVAMLAFLCVFAVNAKKYKWNPDHSVQVYTTGMGQNRAQNVKAWAVAGSTDKAIDQAKMDAVDAALFHGIPFDEKTHGMGVSNLQPLVTQAQYKENETLFKTFFKKGEFLNFVRELNSSYPSGENNVQCKGGRRVGINLQIDYLGLEKWLVENNVKKGPGGHFRN